MGKRNQQAWVVGVLLATAIFLIVMRLQGTFDSQQKSIETDRLRVSPSGPSTPNLPSSPPTSTKLAIAGIGHEGPKANSVAEEFARATNLRTFYDKYLSDRRPEAVYFRARALAICVNYLKQPVHEVERRFTAMGSPDHPVFKKRLESLKLLSNQCGDFYKFDGPDVTLLVAEAAAQGYPPAIAMTLFDLQKQGKNADQRALELLQLNDPEVIERVMPFLTMRNRLVLEDANQTPRAGIVQDAWRLYMCTVGADCSASSRYLVEQCWSESMCGATSVETLFRDVKYSPADYQELIRAHALISNAIQQRNWRVLGLSNR